MLKVDYVVAVDPGYTTQGIVAIDTRSNRITHAITSFTGPSLDIRERILFQLGVVNNVLVSLGQWGGVPLNALLVIEEFHASKFSAAAPTSVWCRGAYDALFRDRLAWKFRKAISVHAMHVRQWSTHKVEPKVKYTAPDILKYTKKANDWLDFEPFVFMNQIEYRRSLGVNASTDKPDKAPNFNEAAIHAVDALVMGTMGLVGCVKPALARGRAVPQQAWVQKINDLYDLSEETQKVVR